MSRSKGVGQHRWWQVFRSGRSLQSKPTAIERGLDAAGHDVSMWHAQEQMVTCTFCSTNILKNQRVDLLEGTSINSEPPKGTAIKTITYGAVIDHIWY
jgi:hypothetical protein